jgi:transposase
VSQRPSSRTKKKQGRTKKHVHVWEQINEYAAGIDAGAEDHYVAVPEGSTEGRAERKFSTTTRGLYELADWLAACGVTSVAVEATGVYCLPLLEVLEARRFEVLLAKPSSLKSVNDRQKTDMKDCRWIQVLHTFGLLRPSYRPNEEVAEYRVYNRHRQTLIEQASTAIEHIKKALTSMNIRLDQAVSDVTGKTGMTIIRAILAGERDPLVLASMRDDRCAKGEATIAEYLTGKWAEAYLFELDHAVQTWDHIHRLIAECNLKLEQQAARFAKKTTREAIPAPRRIEHVRKNVLTFDARELFFEIFGQDLTQIDGISTGTLSVLLAEVGPNVDAWKTEKHFASWLRACPGVNRSGGKNRSGKNRRTTNRLWTALRIAAQTLAKSKSALGAFYRRKRSHLGPEKAINAAAHKLARMIYFTIRFQRAYLDPGPDHYLQRHRDTILKTMEKSARQLGYTLVKAA